MRYLFGLLICVLLPIFFVAGPNTEPTNFGLPYLILTAFVVTYLGGTLGIYVLGPIYAVLIIASQVIASRVLGMVPPLSGYELSIYQILQIFALYSGSKMGSLLYSKTRHHCYLGV